MWYKFEQGNPVGVPRIKNYQVAWYDMSNKGKCFDENFYFPNEIDNVMPYVETIEDFNSETRTRVFANFDDGTKYELKFVKV